jgi:hypothetical protein
MLWPETSWPIQLLGDVFGAGGGRQLIPAETCAWVLSPLYRFKKKRVSTTGYCSVHFASGFEKELEIAFNG